MSNTDDVQERVMKYFDDAVRQLSQSEYRDVLENTIADLESRLDCVKEEMAGDEEES